MKFFRKYSDIDFNPPKSGDAGYDLRIPVDMVLLPKVTANIPLGLFLEIPVGLVGIIKDKSSMANIGIITRGGVIDSSFRGELVVCLKNDSEVPVHFLKNQKIAQLILVPYYSFELEEVEALNELTSTERGQGGFGSTGKF